MLRFYQAGRAGEAGGGVREGVCCLALQRLFKQKYFQLQLQKQ